MAYSGESDAADMVRVLANSTTYTRANHGKYAYTNLGYNIYGLLLKLSLNKKWQDVLQEKVFSPLKLRHTTAYVSRVRSAKWPMAEPYLYSGADGRVIRSPLTKNDNNMQSAGGIVTNLPDLARWLSVNINDGRLDGKQVIPSELIRQARTGLTDVERTEPPFAGKSRYGLGWIIGKYRDTDIVYHNGGFPGWSSHISYMPGAKIGVAVMINESTAGGHIGDLLAAYAYDRLLGTGGVEDLYAKQLENMSAQYTRIKTSTTSAAQERTKRTSQLTHPLADYTGRYTSEEMGTIEISIEHDTLAIRMGNIHVVSTPYTQPESIRVEMVPGQGEIIQFSANASATFDTLTYNGIRFAKKSAR
jgi:CubicO group peptidase (beta-lactamase class C family)